MATNRGGYRHPKMELSSVPVYIDEQFKRIQSQWRQFNPRFHHSSHLQQSNQWRQSSLWRFRSLQSTDQPQLLDSKATEQKDSTPAVKVWPVDAVSLTDSQSSTGKGDGSRDNKTAALKERIRSAGSVASKVPAKSCTPPAGPGGSVHRQGERPGRSSSAQHLGSMSGKASLSRSTGSPYLADQHTLFSADKAQHRIAQHQFHHPCIEQQWLPGHSRLTGPNYHRHPTPSVWQQQEEEAWRKGNYRPDGQQSHDHDNTAISAGKDDRHDEQSVDGQKCARFQPRVAMPFYKAALALMQAQRKRTNPLPVPSPSTRAALLGSSQSFPRQHYRHQDQWVSAFHRQRYHRQPKSILRHTPPTSAQGMSLYGQKLHVQSTGSCEGRRHVLSSASQTLNGTAQKKVTFGDDVSVRSHLVLGSTRRVLEHTTH